MVYCCMTYRLQIVVVLTASDEMTSPDSMQSPHPNVSVIYTLIGSLMMVVMMMG